MTNTKRFDLAEITFNRIVSAAQSRIEDVPHTISWHTDTLAKDNIQLIKSFQGIHKGERCFIIANGPSLKKTNLELLNNEITFGLNRIYLNFQSSSFRPTYYVAVNELILEQFSHEISELTVPKFLNWNRRSYFNLETKNLVYLKPKLVIKDQFQLDLTHPMVFGATVTFVALQLAYYMGFEKVILVGLDHSYIEKGIPNSIELRKNEQDESHFNSQYFPKGIKWQLPDMKRSDLDYRIARDAFERSGREILDATVDGKCSVFSKVEYLSLFNNANKTL